MSTTQPPPVQPPPPPRKRHRVRNLILTGLGLIVVLVVIISVAVSGNNTTSKVSSPTTTPSTSAPATPSSPSTSNLTGPVGTTYKVSGPYGPNGATATYEVTLTKVDQAATLGAYESLSNSGDHMVGLAFTVTGVSGQATDNVNNIATVIGSNGQAYTSSLNSITDGSNFNYGDFTVNPGESMKGWTSYELPPGVTVARVQWTPGIIGTAATWNVTP